MHLRPVDFWLDLRFVASRGAAAAPLRQVGAHALGLVRLDRARMRLLLGNPDRCERFKNLSALDFELAR